MFGKEMFEKVPRCPEKVFGTGGSILKSIKRFWKTDIHHDVVSGSKRAAATVKFSANNCIDLWA